MAIMKWNTPPSGDANDRRSHVVGHGDGVALQHAAFGEKVQGGTQINTGNPNYELATKWSTAPYRGPAVETAPSAQPNPWGYRDKSRANKCMGNDDTCGAWAVDKYDKEYCNAHGNQVTKQAETELREAQA